MLAGQTFENFHEMYQRAVKIARVLKELEKLQIEVFLEIQPVWPHCKFHLYCGQDQGRATKRS